MRKAAIRRSSGGGVGSALALAVLGALPCAAQTPREDAGLEALIERLGAGHEPTGAGVVVAQVEVGAPDRYAASANHPELVGKRFHMASGDAPPSAHATWVGLFFYGLDLGLAPGIRQVEAYEVLDWLGAGFVNGTGPLAPNEIGVAIVNNSWIGDAGPSSNAYVRKIDYAIDEQGITILGGTANGRGPLEYPLLTHCFNGICVGRADGRHGAGETSGLVDGPGRSKPDLVGPAPASSFATPIVAGAAALLVQTAREHANLRGDPSAQRPEVVKSVLMAGARHRSGWSNGAPSAGSARGATDRPLDPLFGADVVDVNRSHWILTAGRALPSLAPEEAPEARHAGWAFVDSAAGGSAWLRVRVAGEKPFVSVIAAWDRHVHPDFAGYDLPDLDLELYALGRDGAPHSLVGEAGLGRFAAGNVQSVSRVDNVEHLYLEGLQPGEYLLELRRSADELGSWPVALAWDFACPAPELYGVAKPSSLGRSARLVPRGVAASFADAFELEIQDGIPGAVAYLVQGSERAERSFAGGSLYVGPAPQRVATVVLDANGGASIRVPIPPERAGTRACYQVFLVDRAQPDGSGAASTNAVDVAFCR